MYNNEVLPLCWGKGFYLKFKLYSQSIIIWHIMCITKRLHCFVNKYGKLTVIRSSANTSIPQTHWKPCSVSWWNPQLSSIRKDKMISWQTLKKHPTQRYVSESFCKEIRSLTGNAKTDTIPSILSPNYMWS